MAKKPLWKRLKYKNIAIALVSIIFIILIISALCSALGKKDDKKKDESSENSSSVADSSSDDSYSVIISTKSKNVVVDNADIHKGRLILVNNEYKYEDTPSELISVYENKTDNYYAKDMEVQLEKVVIQSLNSMLDTFALEKNVKNVIIRSGYRTVAYQQELYDDELSSTDSQTSDYVTKPGYSEHHTGLATDLGLYPSDGVYRAYDGKGDYEWITQNCGKYGLILRYPESKTEKTGIAYEAWHFRYVGSPHSNYIMSQGICLEEYIELLKGYTLDTQPLYVTGNDSINYAIYYIPASENNNLDVTSITIPLYEDGTEYAYEISGNNVDGFIVTVKL